MLSSMGRISRGLTYEYPFGYIMHTYLRTEEFDAWLRALRDQVGKARILARLRSAQLANLGDCTNVGGGVFEMLVHVGPGFRVYFTRRGKTVYLLLSGGDKGSQARDIEAAKEMAKDLENGR
jgi:putative addiction module killer protein